jgi:UDP-2,4-diacetamido-2,4,6-trideoxy-beta-L-altropyranose hydrolase
MRILIRADGDRRIGTGHVMRMLALAARALARGSEVVLASARLDDGLADRARRVGVTVECRAVEPGSRRDAAWVVEQAAGLPADWIVVDGYRFDEAYQEAIRAAGLRLLFVDDYGQCDRWPANLILNQNVSATSALYLERAHDTELLLGPSFALLREEFVAAAAAEREVGARADRILVTMGGADPGNAADRVLDAFGLLRDPSLQVRVVVGPSNPHGPQLAARPGDPRLEILPATDDMASLMAWADIAIAGAGSTVYELCCLGVPTLVIAIAQSQIAFARALDRERLSVDLGWHDTLDPAAVALTITMIRRDQGRRAELSRLGRARVDGRGADRVLDVLHARTDESTKGE